ncbi:hypothetical protein MnTg02_02425 [bacterium MnTg02]|nr:hypothetical protein MnTg02_02425 [bacterium MnTg02]
MVELRDAWELLSNYESHELVRNRYITKHNWQPNRSQSRQIAASFIQAREYFRSADNADLVVKPLLLYYGVVSLSRGLTLFLTPQLWEPSLARSHGLSRFNWHDELSKENPDYLNLAVRVNARGTFNELVHATGNRNLMRSGSSKINLR